MKSTNPSNLILFSLFLLLLNHPQNCQAYSLTGTQLLDLQSNDATNFPIEASSWTASTQKSSNKYTVCGTTYLLGGYNVLGHDINQYFERIYSNLPTHTQINYSLVIWSIDNWSASDTFQLKFDSTIVSGWSLIQRTGLSNLCGDSYYDLPSVRIDGTVAHSATTLTFRAISLLTQSTNVLSFGIRNLNFTFTSPTTPTDSVPCAAAPITLPNTIPTCSCPSGQYETLTHSGSCASCHSSCATCTDSTANACTSCPTGKFLKGTQCVTCDASCGTCNGGNPTDCLTCASGYKKASATGSTMTCIVDQLVIDQSVLSAPSTPNTATFILLAKTTQYVRYLNMNMSPRLAQLAASRGREILSLRFGFGMPSSMEKEFTTVPLSAPFDRQNYHSSFLVNYWLELTSLGIILAVGFVLIILELCFQNSKWVKLHKFFQTFRTITAWNFCFLLLATSLGDVIIFCYLEFSTISSTSSKNTVTNFSVVVAVIALIFLVIFLVSIFMLVRKTYAYKRGLMRGEITHLSMLRWDGSRVLYDGFYTKRMISRLFFLVYTVRLALPMLVAIAIQSSAIANTILQIIINVAMLVILIKFKPLKTKVNQIQMILFESITLVINFFVFILATLDAAKSDAADAIIGIGDLVIILNLILNILIIIFLAIKLFLAIKKIRADAKEQSKDQTFVSCIQLLEIPMQLGGMGFEQTFEDLTLDDDYEDEVPSPLKDSPTQVFEAQSSCGLKIRTSIAGNLSHNEDEDPKSTAMGMSSHVFLLPSLLHAVPKVSSPPTEREVLSENPTERKPLEPQSEYPSQNLICITEVPKDTSMVALSVATMRPMERNPKRGKSVPKNQHNTSANDDRFFMYKEKVIPSGAQAVHKKKKKKNRNELVPPNR